MHHNRLPLPKQQINDGHMHVPINSVSRVLFSEAIHVHMRHAMNLNNAKCKVYFPGSGIYVAIIKIY